MTTVRNLRTGLVQVYSLPPREAVIAAHAQSRGDWNTWDYARKYARKVETGLACVFCGDFGARK